MWKSSIRPSLSVLTTAGKAPRLSHLRQQYFRRDPTLSEACTTTGGSVGGSLVNQIPDTSSYTSPAYLHIGRTVGITSTSGWFIYGCSTSGATTPSPLPGRLLTHASNQILCSLHESSHSRNIPRDLRPSDGTSMPMCNLFPYPLSLGF